MRDRAVIPGDPIDFDFSKDPPRHEPPVAGDDVTDSGAGAGPPMPPPIVAPGATVPVAPAGAPVTDFRTQSYPFAVTSRFQQGGFSDPHAAPRASHRRRLAWGILAAVGAVLFAASVIVVMQVIDSAMNG